MDMHDARSDAELLTMSAAGDRSAFEVLAGRYDREVRRYCRHLARSEADAEDAAQAAFTQAWRAAGTFDTSASSARAWLLTIARHCVYRLARPRRASERPIDAATIEDLGGRAGFGEPEFTAERVAQAAEDRDLLEQAMGSLEDEDRDVLFLRDVRGLGGQEAASVLGLSLDAMKSRLHRSRLRFAAAVRERVYAQREISVRRRAPSIADHNRLIAGLWCTEVLARLSDYLDGELPPEERAGIEAHVSRCDHCTRFGGVFTAAVRAIRRALGDDAP